MKTWRKQLFAKVPEEYQGRILIKMLRIQRSTKKIQAIFRIIYLRVFCTIHEGLWDFWEYFQVPKKNTTQKPIITINHTNIVTLG